MVRSLRWRLLGWQALLLLTMLGGFGTVLYVVSRQARFDEIDAELLAAARILEGGLRPLPRGILEGSAPSGSRPPRPPRPRDGNRPGPPPALDFPMPPEVINRALSLPRLMREKYAQARMPPYYVVWRWDGSVLKAVPALTPERPSVPLPDERPPAEEPHQTRQRGTLREMLLRGPERTLILVGRSIDAELADLDHLTWVIFLTGLGVFTVGMAAGWWLASQAVRPLRKMSATAATITAANLSQRLDLIHVDTELGQLGEILNAMLDRLEASFSQQVRFTADASHELRTPLAVVLSHTELALARERPAEEYRQALATCQRAALRMRTLVESLMTLARLDAAGLQMQVHPVDLADLARDSVDLLQPLAEERGIRLELELAPVLVLGDADRLGQVVTNLITNAILYNRDGGRVTVSVLVKENLAFLRVVDTGIGIPAEDLPHIFERFYRVDKARTRAAGGSGLGLAICQSILTAHGGTLTVSSTVDVGSTFEISLPLGTATSQEPGTI